METNANEREFDTTNETNEDETYEQDTQNIPEEDDEASTDGGDSSDGDTEEDDSVSVSKSEYEKLQREAAAAKRLREKRSQEPKEKPGKEAQYDQELIERTYLAAQLGVQDADIQDEAIRLARKFDMSIHEAAKDPDIASRLKNLQKRKEQQRSIAKDQKGSPAQTKGIEHWVKKFQADGSLPDDPKLQAQILDKLGG